MDSKKGPVLTYLAANKADSEQGIPKNGQYLFMRAGLTNRVYSNKQFVNALMGVDLDNIQKEECRKDVSSYRLLCVTMAKNYDRVKIRDFDPDKDKLEAVVDTTFSDIFLKLHRQKRRKQK
jgi:hypothetical protein